MSEERLNGILVTNIQRMCFHDGPGIRTVVFLKGCTIHCPWCSNPENLSYNIEKYEKDGNTSYYGRYYTEPELHDELLKDRLSWINDGGITFSGGEPLSHIPTIKNLLKSLKTEGIDLAVETSLFVDENMIDVSLCFFDHFIVDIKILDEQICNRVLGGDCSLYKRNVKRVVDSGKDLVFRIPCNNEYTLTDKNSRSIIEFLKQYRDIPVQIFAIHDLGAEKYRSLGIEMWRHEKVKEKSLLDFKDELTMNGISTEIIKL